MNSYRVIQPRQETSDAINWLANNDLKALGFIGLTIIGESTTTQLARELANTHPDAFSSVLGYPITYAKGKFAEVRSDMGSNGRPANFYKATREIGALSLIGSLLKWSETYNFPLVTMLSVTASKGEASAPINTVQILDGLQSNLTITEMALPGYKPNSNGEITAHNTRLKTLVELGMIESKNEPIAVRILNPSYNGSVPFDKLKTGRQGFYRTVLLAKELNPEKEWTVEQLTEIAYKYNFINNRSSQDFHSALIRAISSKTPRYAPGVFKKQDLQPKIYTLSQQYASMIHDLIESTIQVDESPKYASESRDYAHDIYHSPDVAFRIAERGLSNSAYRKN